MSLYIISTPIGNLEDITIRAINTLSKVDIILAEDTRKTKILLDKYQINDKKLIPYFSGNEKKIVNSVINMLKEGKEIGMVSEAGTPLISDPGYILVKKAIEENIKVIPIPGVTAFTTLLPVSGLPVSSFYFVGFLSNKKIKKRNQLGKLKNLETVIVLYESVHRIEDTIEAIKEVFGKNIEIVIGRELTKKYEEIIRGQAGSININFEKKGEFCIIINNIT
ncbi:MAG TPA: 16S rRNA (cytidine(1402)-2'-O)-methyltransferase [Spirochaetota bacterium]|nr:16S rRNA (cytidine(1402)-2'-O)-methyltransferase [Spirochaetota bacterium]HOM38966.1 16S rRNA (cytidine(1402)-2'-O)-methyltransferase [Spirochaetota bacterium]HPQ48374.1 16S rRNA (cytidine(1402)-2'-O)-methyltransferase [Spirochaetota bacterium]